MKLHKNDEIIVVKGKDKGKKGKIEKVFSKAEKVLIPDLNQFKRHVKGNAQGQKSEIMTIAKPMQVANVALLCPHCKKPTRVGYKMEKGKKVRVCRKCEKVI
jgi:large subunit ribosomal protein L24